MFILSQSSSLTTESFISKPSYSHHIFPIHLNHGTSVLNEKLLCSYRDPRESRSSNVRRQARLRKVQPFLASPPTSTTTGLVKKPYEEPMIYKKEVINDGRALHDYPAHLPPPQPGYAVRREQVPDEDGGMRYKYITRRVDPEVVEKEADTSLMTRVKKLVPFTRN
ncbi:hypothetical protein BD769DRAFT_1673897 [Suillus cothurnatus]|nr:hypothetical protein BD769DRAFT_1673897 [Suillus cothurnatus]